MTHIPSDSCHFDGAKLPVFSRTIKTYCIFYNIVYVVHYKRTYYVIYLIYYSFTYWNVQYGYMLISDNVR